MKQTKIIATLGPLSSDLNVIKQLIQAGVNVFRLNFSHGNHELHKENINKIRLASKELDTPIGIMGDLQGPKIRISKFINSKVELTLGQDFILDAKYDKLGDSTIVGIDYKELVQDVKPQDILVLDDGKIAFEVIEVINNQIHCKVIQEGTLSNNKGINKKGGGLTACALTSKDYEDLEFCCLNQIDYIAISFVASAIDIQNARNFLYTHNSNSLVIAKIERVEAIDNMQSIIEASDGIMVARGDLAIEVGEACVPALQKKLIKCARKNYKLTIVATQMLESMINSPVATRAEISDIANAVLDGTDAVMLSAESASGKYPVLAVKAMAQTCLETENNHELTLDLDFTGKKFDYIDQTVALSALFSAYHLQAQAIIAFTTSGVTAYWLSRFESGVPIYAITNSLSTARRMSLYKAVQTILIENIPKSNDEVISQILHLLINKGALKKDDTIILTTGNEVFQVGGTNTMQIIKAR